MPLPTSSSQLSSPTNQLPDLPEGPLLERVRGPIDLPAYETWQIALAVALVLLFAGWLIWRLLKKQTNPAAKMPPYEAAIDELETASVLTEGDDERFAVLCSQALRRYLEQGHGLKFSARTSEEFLRSLKGNTTLEANYQHELASVLRAFDQIKFARAGINPAQRNEISNTVRSLIDRAHGKRDEEGGEP